VTPRALSSGEQQRVAIVRAIVADAPAILADEPTAGENGRAVMQILADFAKDRSRGALVVTHDQRLRPFANRVSISRMVVSSAR
jgi:putative ABC transport system ATP-binding protein